MRRTLKQLAAACAEDFGVTVEEMRGPRQWRALCDARLAFYALAYAERPDLASSQIGNFINRDGSTIRHAWRQMREAA